MTALLPSSGALVAVRPHPDDEVLATGGLLALGARCGRPTVLVTCTDGSQGDGPAGAKPGEEGHDPDLVARWRRLELRASCRRLGIDELVELGWRDSGMDGWPANQAAGAFCQAPLDQVAQSVAEVLDRTGAAVVVTDDEHGTYGHPDHVRCHQVTLRALELLRRPIALCFPALRRARLAELAELARSLPFDAAELGVPEDIGTWGRPDEELSDVLDVSEVVDAKLGALRAHSSQVDTAWLARLPDTLLKSVLREEAFVRAGDQRAWERVGNLSAWVRRPAR
jgi:LmbE family N-acetylglucosaminyl deacetylase